MLVSETLETTHIPIICCNSSLPMKQINTVLSCGTGHYALWLMFIDMLKGQTVSQASGNACCFLVACLDYSSNLDVEGDCCCRMSVNF
jgi:hypothetical protein